MANMLCIRLHLSYSDDLSHSDGYNFVKFKFITKFLIQDGMRRVNMESFNDDINMNRKKIQHCASHAYKLIHVQYGITGFTLCNIIEAIKSEYVGLCKRIEFDGHIIPSQYLISTEYENFKMPIQVLYFLTRILGLNLWLKQNEYCKMELLAEQIIWHGYKISNITEEKTMIEVYDALFVRWMIYDDFTRHLIESNVVEPSYDPNINTLEYYAVWSEYKLQQIFDIIKKIQELIDERG